MEEQKKIIIFGAGAVGSKVCNLLGKESILCFIDNNAQGELDGIPIIKLSDIFLYYPTGKVVVASYYHYPEMCNQLENAGITDYLVWKPSFDRYFDYITMYEGGWHRYGYTYLNGLPMSGTPVVFPLCPIIFHLVEAQKEAIGIYSYNGVEDLFIFLFYAYGIADRIKYIFRTRKQNCFRIPDEIKKLSAYDNSDKEYENFKNAKGEMDSLLITVERRDIDLCPIEELYDEDFEVFDMFDITPYIFPNPSISRMKNIYQGKRCFIVGNGPSLKTEDLDTLKLNNEICFGVNKIFMIFDKTDWRPDFLAVVDKELFIHNTDKFLSLDIPIKFFVNWPGLEIEKKTDYFLNYLWEYAFPNKPRFSAQPDRIVFGGRTTVYDICIQMAVYMGFKEIYLLGVDNTMSYTFHVSNHFIKDYYSDEEATVLKSIGYRPCFDEIDLAYKHAEWHSRKNGYRIFNATRGGKLEIFERVDFETLFS